MKLFMRLKEKSNPSNWTLKTYLLTALFLICLNAFGSQGLIKMILMYQEENRLSKQVSDQNLKISSLEKEIHRFKKSESYKLKIIRQELGLLKSDEISFELTDRLNEN